MNCPLKTEENVFLLLDYSAGRLLPDKMAAVEKHMEICPDCAAFRREQTAVWRALDAWAPAPVSMDFNRRLWQRIEAANAAPWYRQLADSLRFGNWKPAVPLAAAVVMVAAGFMLDHPGSRTLVPGETLQGGAGSVSITDANQVEQTLDDIQLLRQFDSAAVQNDGNSLKNSRKQM